MAYIGGLGYFIGPILGAVILTLMNSLLSNYSDLWMLYLGIMFLLTVLFLPRGFAGFIMMHQVAWLKGSLKNLALPYLITCIPAILFLVGAIGMLEMSHSEDAIFHFLGMELDTSSTITWLAAIIFTLGSLFATSKSLPQLRDAWEEANTIPEVVKEDES